MIALPVGSVEGRVCIQLLSYIYTEAASRFNPLPVAYSDVNPHTEVESIIHYVSGSNLRLVCGELAIESCSIEKQGFAVHWLACLLPCPRAVKGIIIK